MTLITRISPLTKIKKIELNLDNIKYIINDGSSYYIARKRGRNSFFFKLIFLRRHIKIFLTDTMMIILNRLDIVIF